MTDYEKTIRVEASPETLFDSLTSLTGLAAWWTRATGSGVTGGELRFLFDSPQQPCVMHVDQATRPTSVQWTCTEYGVLPDWVGTQPIFTIAPADDGASELYFRHRGLTPELDCIDVCTRGWDHFLVSLRDYAETGRGMPFGSSADKARRSKVILGNHAAIVLPRAEQDRIRRFYRDVLGCEIIRETDEKDDFRMGDNFYIGVLYEDKSVALDESSFSRAIYLELAADDVEEMRRKITAFGVKVLEMQDPHLYFQAPGGQVFRLVAADEDLSTYEGTDHRELPRVFG